jgi:hypothetical protein
MGKRSADNDERYILDICDRILRVPSQRQMKFDFLLGDPNPRGSKRRLPVDAYYEDLKLAIEFREIQHFKTNGLMDLRSTCSGVLRGEQRRIYDERRRTLLPANGIRLLEIDYHFFNHSKQGRLRRDLARDEDVIRKLLNHLQKNEDA